MSICRQPVPANSTGAGNTQAVSKHESVRCPVCESKFRRRARQHAIAVRHACGRRITSAKRVLACFWVKTPRLYVTPLNRHAKSMPCRQQN